MTPEAMRKLVYPILSAEQIEKFENDPVTRHELDFAYSLKGVGRFRCNIYQQQGSIAGAMRALQATIPKLHDLGLPNIVRAFADIHKGLALVTGPTGSGKTTTLAALIDIVNETREDHIITIEDPIEYVHTPKKCYISQREVGPNGDTMSFKNALKYALRQDPDVILVGEMRDYETMGIAITSAETGHLVFGTLHTVSASQTIGRIIDVFPPDQQPQIITQLSANLAGVVSQIILPRADGQGRVVACEVMRNNVAIRNLIKTNNIDGIYQSIGTGGREGMQTMDSSILALVKEGLITYETALPRLRDDSSKRQIEEYKGKAPRAASPPAPAPAPASPAPAQDRPSESAPASKSSLMSGVIPPWEKR
jgi:twitching motility protein PilT